MKKNRLIIFALSLIFAVSGPGLLGGQPSIAAQKPIPPECVESCRQLLLGCISAGGNEHRCIAIYRSCVAKCK